MLIAFISQALLTLAQALVNENFLGFRIKTCFNQDIKKIYLWFVVPLSKLLFVTVSLLLSSHNNNTLLINFSYTSTVNYSGKENERWLTKYIAYVYFCMHEKKNRTVTLLGSTKLPLRNE